MSGSDNYPLVSVIINCYNGEKYLREAIESVYAQSYQNWEIIFWDNCSNDNSAEIAKSYKDRFFYYKSNVNTPLGHARNLALEKSKGEFISFLDSDDIWEVEKLSKQVNKILENEKYCLCYCGVEEIFENGNHFRYYLPNYESGLLVNKLLEKFNIHIVAALIRKEALLESNLNFDTNLTASEEYCLFINLSLIFPISVINEPLVKYRVSPNSLSVLMSNKLGYERRYALDKLKQHILFNKIVDSKKYKKAYLHSYYYDAKYYASINEKYNAIKKMFKTKFVNIRYIPLLILLVTSIKLWEKIHLKYRNRY